MPAISSHDFWFFYTFVLFLVKYLLCGVQNYDWGVKGSSSLVAKLKLGNDHSFTIDEELPYAELWMGAHPKLESVVITENGQINLSKFLNINGKRSLPYMMKVLSINEALSIQVHPDLETAKKLHAHAPAEYPDSNHKPEMAIALTPFAALIGIRPAEEIYNLLKNLTPITKIIKINVLDKLKIETQAATAIKTIISDLTSLDSNNVMTVFNQLILHNDNPMHYLFCQLHQQHPYDVGCFFAYFMNYVELKIGEAIFIEPNTIHAYLEGDIIECMALSDNVVRLGLTKKYKDRATMLAIADFIPRSINYFFPTTEITQMDSKNNISITRYLSSKAEFKTTCIKIYHTVKDGFILKVRAYSVMIGINGQLLFGCSDKLERNLLVTKGTAILFTNDVELYMTETEKNVNFVSYIIDANESYFQRKECV